MVDFGKRGLSEIVTVVIIIALILTASGLVYISVQKLMNANQDDVEADLTRVNLEIIPHESFSLNPTGNLITEENSGMIKIENGKIILRLRRNIGEGEMVGVRFIIFDGESTVFSDVAFQMGELEEHIFEIPVPSQINAEDIQVISIAPRIKVASGKEYLRDITDFYSNLKTIYCENNDDCSEIITRTECIDSESFREIGYGGVCNKDTNICEAGDLLSKPEIDCEGGEVCLGGKCLPPSEILGGVYWADLDENPIDAAKVGDTIKLIGYDKGAFSYLSSSNVWIRANGKSTNIEIDGFGVGEEIRAYREEGTNKFVAEWMPQTEHYVSAEDGTAPLFFDIFNDNSQYRSNELVLTLDSLELSWENSLGEVITNANVGDTIYLVGRNSGLAERANVEFNIFEDDPYYDDYIKTLNGMVDNERVVKVSWTITQADYEASELFDHGEYYFEALGKKSAYLSLGNPTEVNPDCYVSSASWSSDYGDVGENIDLIVTIGDSGKPSNCDENDVLGIKIYESDIYPNPDDSVEHNLDLVDAYIDSDGGASIYQQWKIEWQSDTDGFESNPPEYFFVAEINGEKQKYGESGILRMECGNGICRNGENCDTCPEDCLDSGEVCCSGVSYEGNCCLDSECSLGSCVEKSCENCDLIDAYWSSTEAYDNGMNRVNLVLRGNPSCKGLQVIYEIYEDDGLLPDDFVTSKAGWFGISEYELTAWVVDWQEDQNNPPEFYFNAHINGGDSINSGKTASSELKVYTCGDGICNFEETSYTCLEDCPLPAECLPYDGIVSDFENCANCPDQFPGGICCDGIHYPDGACCTDHVCESQTPETEYFCNGNTLETTIYGYNCNVPECVFTSSTSGTPCGNEKYCTANYCKSCAEGYANCNENAFDACETNIYNDDNNCGACGAICEDGNECVQGSCTSTIPSCGEVGGTICDSPEYVCVGEPLGGTSDVPEGDVCCDGTCELGIEIVPSTCSPGDEICCPDWDCFPHILNDCVVDGGIIVDKTPEINIDSEYLCEFPGSSCPSGWGWEEGWFGASQNPSCLGKEVEMSIYNFLDTPNYGSTGFDDLVTQCISSLKGIKVDCSENYCINDEKSFGFWPKEVSPYYPGHTNWKPTSGGFIDFYYDYYLNGGPANSLTGRFGKMCFYQIGYENSHLDGGTGTGSCSVDHADCIIACENVLVDCANACPSEGWEECFNGCAEKRVNCGCDCAIDRATCIKDKAQCLLAPASTNLYYYPDTSSFFSGAYDEIRIGRDFCEYEYSSVGCS